MTIRISNTWNANVLRSQVETTPNTDVEYRYIITDLLTDTVVAEVPFIDVKYSRALIRFGSFEGDIPVIPSTAHLNLYTSTLPGKRALYVLRNGKAVWGGIIWTRSYNAVSRTLHVTGSEFISYLYSRILWAPLPTYVTGADAPKFDICDVAKDIVDRCMNDLRGTLFDPESQLDIVNQYPVNTYGILNIARASGTATFTTDKEHGLIPGQEVRLFGVDQSVNISDTDFDKNWLVATVPTPTTFTAEIAGIDVASTVLKGIRQYDIIGYSTGAWNGVLTAREVPNGYRDGSEEYLTPGTTLKAGVGTLWLAPDEDHDIALFDTATVNLSTVDDLYFDAIKRVEYVYPSGNPYYIQYYLDAASWAYATTSQWNTSAKASKVDDVQGTLVVGPRVVSTSYGPFTEQSDIGISTELITDSGLPLEVLDPSATINTKFSTFGQVLESYANSRNAFDYRVDVEYDDTTKTFHKYFHVEPRTYRNVVTTSTEALREYGAEDRIFEYPGNITDMSIDESIETSATRMLYTGSGDGATSTQYAMRGNMGLLNGTNQPALGKWPLWDASESGVKTTNRDYLELLAEEALLETYPPVADFKITVNGSLHPSIDSYLPGDWCGIVAPVDVFIQERLDNDFETDGVNVIIRKINAYTVTVPNDMAFPESVDIEFMLDYKAVLPSTTTIPSSVGKSGYWIGVVHNFNGTYVDSAADTTGNIYVVGEDSDATKSVVVKYDKTSAVSWSKILDKTPSTSSSIALNTSKLPVTSMTSTYAGEGLDGVVTQFDATGAISWVKRWNSLTREYSIRSIVVDSTNHVVAGGFAVASGGTNVGLVAKYTTTGELYWQRLISLNTNYDTKVMGVSVDADNNVYVCLQAVTILDPLGTPVTTDHTYVQMYNYNGEIVWERKITTSTYNYPTGIAALAGGGCYVVGDYLNGADYNGYVIRYDKYGAILWKKYIKDARTNHVRAVCVDSAGAAYILGDTQVDGSNTKMFIVKMQTVSTALKPVDPSWDGEIVWRRLFFTDNVNPDIAGSISLNDDKSFTVTGYTIKDLATMGSPQYNVPIIAKLPTNGRYMNTYAVGPTDPLDPLYPPYIFSYTANESLVIGDVGFTQEKTVLNKYESAATNTTASITDTDVAGYAANSTVYGI